jgi:hypothetical protein
MRIIEIDAANWKTVLDFCHALLDAIGAPAVHGMSPDAFVDSMIWGGMNSVEPPYAVLVSGLAAAPKEVRDYVELVKEALWEGRVYRKRHNGDDVEVSIEISRADDGSEFDGQEARKRNAAEISRVEYEGPDPRVRETIDVLWRKLNLGPLREQ